MSSVLFLSLYDLSRKQFVTEPEHTDFQQSWLPAPRIFLPLASQCWVPHTGHHTRPFNVEYEV